MILCLLHRKPLNNNEWDKKWRGKQFFNLACGIGSQNMKFDIKAKKRRSK